MTYRRAALATVLLLIGLLVPAPAQAAEKLRLTVDRHVLYGGQQLVVTARSSVDCGFAVTWDGDSRGGTGRVLVAAFTAPTVTRITRIKVHAACFLGTGPKAKPAAAPARGSAGPRQRLTVTVPTSLRRTVVVTVLPRGSAVSPPDTGGGTVLPSTGGPDRLLILLGLGSALVGAGLVATCRKRANHPKEMKAAFSAIQFTP
ncbi:LPXTG cell wall anchor domain-containing protein [Nocardioides marmoriginsengisoli]|uniref:LPXTG cell wall anchor domain-containing protein n=1 Tax=Nocardioides marmoriginsengisoli TaxID=661483 RepID=A0A3N0CFF9_9ACTN|nr:LPXTG cell wall anchor domain-containing protein [Nocardioides marmoriginsengisoli]RNL62200.1 LPXTG cell wall anchor domain-containing protein [Nocardioides marmoriginsengisoli]